MRRRRARPGWRRGGRRLLLFVLIAIAAAAHIAFWYLPRERTGEPESGGVAEQLLHDPNFSSRIWIPYPHQNLAVLESSIGDLDAFLLAVARVGGGEAPEIPTFGPFRVPPAKELVLAFDEESGRFVAAARVYPALGILARLAGKLAGNPWLSGGPVELSGDPAEVAWRDGFWTVTSPVGFTWGQTAAAPVPQAGKVLAHLELGRRAGVVPPGGYSVFRGPHGIEIVGGGQPPSCLVEDLGNDDGVVVVTVARTPTTGTRAAALFDGLGRLSLPRTAVFSTPGSKRFNLPGERLLKRLGRQFPQAQASGWTVIGLDAGSLEEGRGVAPRLAPYLESGACEESTYYALWASPGPAKEMVGAVVEVLEEVPFLGKRHARRWRDWEALLVPLSSYSQLRAEIGPGKGSVRLQLRP